MTAPGWLTGKADAGSLPALLERLASEIDVSTVDDLWVFPTKRVAGVESTVFVLSLHEQDERRRVSTAHVRATRNKRGEPLIEIKLDEHATAPAERLPRVIEGVLRRLSEDFAAAPPSSARIGGSSARWLALIDELTNHRPGEPLPEVLLSSEEDSRASGPSSQDSE